MSKIYGYCMEVALKGMAKAKLKAQKNNILEVYSDAIIVMETVGKETRKIIKQYEINNIHSTLFYDDVIYRIQKREKDM